MISGRFSPVFQYRIQICEIIFYFLGLLNATNFTYLTSTRMRGKLLPEK